MPGSGGVSAGARLFVIPGGRVIPGRLSNSLSIFLVFVNSPVEYVIVLETLADEKVPENLSEVRVVWLVIEAERASVVEIDGKLVGKAAAENFSWSRHLLFHDAV